MIGTATPMILGLTEKLFPFWKQLTLTIAPATPQARPRRQQTPPEEELIILQLEVRREALFLLLRAVLRQTLMARRKLK